MESFGNDMKNVNIEIGMGVYGRRAEDAAL